MTNRHLVRALGTLLVLEAACAGGGAGRDEVARIPGPDQRVDAVLVETNGGATTSFGYELYLVRPGRAVPPRSQRVADLYGAVRSDSAYGVDLRWAGPAELRVQYLHANAIEVERPTATVDGRVVHVVLDSGVADLTALAGGMLWNRRGRPK